MAPTTLTCRECGQTYPLEALYVCELCFGPLEVTYDQGGLGAAEAKRKIQAGPAGIWRYADFLPLADRPRDPLQPGLTPLVRADRLADRLGIGELWIKNDAANPTHSFKDRVVAVALAKARELGFETVACASTGNLANAVAAHAAAAGLESYVFVPADLEEQKLLATGVYGTRLVGVRGNYDDVNRLCTRTLREAALGLRERQPAPVLLRGVQDASPTSWSSSSAGRCPTGSSARSPPVRCSRRSPRACANGSTSGWSPASSRRSTAPRRTAATPWPRPTPPGTTSVARSAPTRSPRASRSATPPTAPYALDLARETDGSIESVTDDEIRAGIRLLAETTGIFTETAGGVTTAVLAKLAEAGTISDSERVVAIITGEGLKTLDAVRDGFRMDEIEPTLDSFEARIGEAALTATAG